MHRKTLIDAVLHAVLLLVLVFLVGLRLWPRHSKGMRVRIAPDTCIGLRSLIDTLEVTSEGGILFGTDAVGMNGLVMDLRDSYGSGSEGVLYFSADGNIPFQRIAEVINAVQQTTQTHYPPLPEALRNPATDNLNIELRLITPGAVDTPCRENTYNWWKEGFQLVRD